MTDLPATKPLDDSSNYLMVRVDAIDASKRMRKVNENTALEISESIAKEGLFHAIMVREIEGQSDAFCLVHGAHRLRAHRILGLDYVKADVTRLPSEQAKRIERDENFFREGLTKLEQVVSAGSFQDEWEALNGPFQRGGDRTNGADESKAQTLRFASLNAELSEKSGKSERSIQDLLAVYRALGPDLLKTLTESPVADNMVQLKALARLSKDQQMTAARGLADGAYKAVKDYRIAVGDLPHPPKPTHPSDIWMQKMISLWAEGSKKDRAAFLREVGGQT